MSDFSMPESDSAPRIGSITEEFSVDAVPVERTVHGLNVGLVLIGISITISAFLTGSQLGLAMGLTNVVIAILVGSLVLSLIGCTAAVIAARSRLTTYMIVQFPFGSKGAKVVNMIISVTIFGWFTVTASFFGESIQQAAKTIWSTDINLALLTVCGSILVIVTTVFGFRAIDRLSQLTVPLLFGTLIYVAYLAVADATLLELQAYPGNTMTLGQGITAVIGSYIVAAVILPDYCRYVKNTQHGLLAATLNFGIAYPVILVMLAVVAIHSGEKNFIHILITMGLGIVGVLVLVFATWTTNIGNLYSNSLVLKTIFTKVPQWQIVIVAGGMGTLLAVAGVTHYFIDFLLFLGVTIPPVAGIYIADYFFVHTRRYQVEDLAARPAVAYPAFAAWLIASIVGYMTTRDWIVLTTIPACDSIMLAFSLYLLHQRFAAARRDALSSS